MALSIDTWRQTAIAIGHLKFCIIVIIIFIIIIMIKYSEIKSHLNPKFLNHNIQLYTAEISVL